LSPVQITAAQLKALGYELGPRQRRSWPGPVTKLERIAAKAGLEGDEYRDLLWTAIQRRRRERGEAWEKLDRTLEMREAL
jgi:hypothetical protein